MARETNNTRPWLAALLGLVAGLIIGVIIAWGVWPVSYKNTLPQDLRSAERDQYLAMVATSLAATGDAQTADQRLQTWPSDDLAVALANLQERLATTDPATAAAVEQLASTLNLGAVDACAQTWRRIQSAFFCRFPGLEDALHIGGVDHLDPGRGGCVDLLVPSVACGSVAPHRTCDRQHSASCRSGRLAGGDRTA